jgi:hypothetical protein
MNLIREYKSNPIITSCKEPTAKYLINIPPSSLSLDQPSSKKEKKEIDTQIQNIFVKYFDLIKSSTVLRFP